MTDAELDKAIAELKSIDTYTHSINAQAVADAAADAIATLREQVAELQDGDYGVNRLAERVAAAEIIAEKAEADNAALRRIVGLAKEMRSVMLPVDAEDDEILRRFDAALLAGKDKP